MVRGIQALLKALMRWFDGQSKQKLEEKIRKELLGPGVRLQFVERRTDRAVATWVAIYYADPQPYNIHIGLDTLSHVEGVKPIAKENGLSTHALSIIRQDHHTYIPAGSNQRRSRREELLNEEVIFQTAYQTEKDQAADIIETLARLLVSCRIEAEYFRRYHPDLDLLTKRKIEIKIALRVSYEKLRRSYSEIKESDYRLIQGLLQNPDVPKRLLYPPSGMEHQQWKDLVTLAARHQLNRSTLVVFPQDQTLEAQTVEKELASERRRRASP